MSLNDLALIFMGGYAVAVIAAALVMALRPGAGATLLASGEVEAPFQVGVPRRPQRFAVRDVVRLARRGRPLARVERVLDGGRLVVWIMENRQGPVRWMGPREVLATDVTNNYGPLDDVGIGSKMSEH